MPAFDEYAVAYKDRGEIVPPAYVKKSSYGLKPVVVVRGRVAGIWKRTAEKGKVVVEVSAFEPFSKAIRQAVTKEAKRFGGFMGKDEVAVEIIR